jgi:hypothetical protein
LKKEPGRQAVIYLLYLLGYVLLPYVFHQMNQSGPGIRFAFATSALDLSVYAYSGMESWPLFTLNFYPVIEYFTIHQHHQVDMVNL